MRVCHILSGDLWAGAEAMAFNLINGLRIYNELDVDVILLNEGIFAEKLRNRKFNVYVLDEQKNSFISILRKFNHLAKTKNYQILHSHRYKENILTFLVGFENNCKMLSTQHGMPEIYDDKIDFSYSILSYLNFFILRKFFHSIICVSRDIENILCNKNHIYDNISTIHNGIEIPTPHLKRKPTDRFTIGTCGRLFPVKGYDLFIKTAKVVLNTFPNIYFEIAGDGPENEHLKALISYYDMDKNVKLLGHVENINEFYSKLDLYILTSYHEGIPMSVLEAMSFGLPIIATDVGGLRELIDDGINGYLIRSRDPHLVAEKCNTLIRNNTLATKFSKASYHKLHSNFSIERTSLQYYNLYRNLIETDNSSSRAYEL